MVRRSNALIDERRDAALECRLRQKGILTGNLDSEQFDRRNVHTIVTFDPTFTIIENLLYGNLSEVSFLDRNPELPLAGYCNVDYEINRNQFE